jgi:hypothetical protein
MIPLTMGEITLNRNSAHKTNLRGGGRYAERKKIARVMRITAQVSASLCLR